MADRLKYRVRFSTSLDKKTVHDLKEYSDKTMIPVSRIVDVAVQEYVNKHKDIIKRNLKD
jgi:hypothetical protein